MDVVVPSPDITAASVLVALALVVGVFTATRQRNRRSLIHPMKAGEVVDWRVWKAAQVAADAGAAKAGDHMYVITNLKGSVHGAFSFITPSPIALSLEIAIRSARKAEELRAALSPEKVNAGPWLKPDQLKQLYPCFQECMVAATFSFQSLEAFANHVIGHAAVPKIEVEWRGKLEEWTPDEVERWCSTEEKLGRIIPAIAKVPTIKGTALWERLQRLKDLRDSSTHLKSLDQYKQGTPDDLTLYYRFMNADLLDGPRVAMDIIAKYSDPASLAWIEIPRQMLG